MAEPIGLALGAVALVSLFSSCVELANYFELRKSCQYDYSVACLKLSLLRSRLKSWGHTLRVRDTDQEDKESRQNWLQEEDLVEQSLLGIQSIFGDTELLKDKYKLVPRTSKTLSCSQEARSKSALVAQDQTSSSYSSKCRRFSVFRQSTKWAIRDKEKFDAFLHDLEFLISNLEHVQSRLDISPRLIQEAEEHCGVEGNNNNNNMNTNNNNMNTNNNNMNTNNNNMNTTPQSKEGSCDQVQVRSATNSEDNGSSWKHNENEFTVGKISDQALYLHGMQGENSGAFIVSESKNTYTAHELKDQSTGMQGYNSTQAIRDVLESRRAMLIDRNGMIKPDELRTDGQKHTQPNASGRVLGK